MSDYVKVIQACIDEAPQDEGAARILRQVVRGAADRAPIDALVEMVQQILEIRERDIRLASECN